MCTHARIPSSSRRTESASSKSFAVSGSMVNESSSRRSTRPSRLGSGGSYGSKGPRRPRSTSSPSSAASIDLAGPSTRSTRALPRPGRTTTRSPASASPSPFRSRTSGTPGAKKGSPTTSLPRRATSTTTSPGSVRARSDAEEAAERDPGAGGSEAEAHAEDRERVQDEGDRADVAARVDVAEDRRQHELLAEEQQHDGRQRAHKACDQPLQHERAANEPVRGADELHHLDLAPPGEDGEPDRVGDQKSRGDEQDEHRDHEHELDHARDAEDPLGRLLAVVEVVHPGRVREEASVDRIRILGLLRLHLLGGGKRVRRQRPGL